MPGIGFQNQIHASLFHRNIWVIVIAAGLLEKIDRVNDGCGRTENNFRDHDLTQFLLDNLLTCLVDSDLSDLLYC